MEGQTATTEAASSDTSAADAGAAAAATTAEATKAEAQHAAESAGKGESLLADGNAGDDVKAPEATQKAEGVKTGDDKAKADEGSETSPDGQDAAKEGKKPEGEADATKEGEEADGKEAKAEGEEKDDAEEKLGDPVLDGLPENFHWRDLLTDDKNKNRATHFGSLDEVMEAVRELDSLKRRAVLPPNQKSTDEEIATFRKRMGVPDTPDGYEIELDKAADDSDREFVSRLQMIAHANNLTPGQLDSLRQWYNDETTAIEQFEESKRQEALAKARTDLSREWLSDYQRNIGIAKKAFDEAFGGYAEDVGEMKLADGTRLIDHPMIARGLFKMGRRFTEAGIPGSNVAENWNPTENELIEMQQRQGYIDGSDKQLLEQVKVGYKRLYGSK